MTDTLPPQWRRVSGDVDDTLVARVGGVTDLLWVDTIEGHVWRAASSVAAVTLAASVIDPDERTVLVQLGGVDGGWLPTAAPGRWLFELQMTGVSGERLTWPAEEGDAWIEVRRQGA